MANIDNVNNLLKRSLIFKKLYDNVIQNVLDAHFQSKNHSIRNQKKYALPLIVMFSTLSMFIMFYYNGFSNIITFFLITKLIVSKDKYNDDFNNFSKVDIFY